MTVEDDRTRDQLSRIDVKLDVLISQHGQLATSVTDHEQRLRPIEASVLAANAAITELRTDKADHETRLRAADRWRYALPVTTVGALVAAAGGLFSAIKAG